jgi:hypothetical protein
MQSIGKRRKKKGARKTGMKNMNANYEKEIYETARNE